MVKLSRFAYTYEVSDGNVIALYHSLRMKPVYLSRDVFQNLQAWLASSCCKSVDDAPELIKTEVQELIRWKILTQSEDEDERILQFVKSKIPKPATSICYFILSEQCNLACRYCFLGNNDEKKRHHFSSENMTQETADKALDFFIRQMKESGLDNVDNRASIIFYGGEPLVNYKILEYIAAKINSLRDKEKCLKNAELSIVTNGLLLNEERIQRLRELKVSLAISVDGATEEANAMRVDMVGNPAFKHILKTLDLCKKLGVEFSLSVTLSEETEDILNLLDKYGVKSLGFNIMMSSDTFVLPQEYNRQAAEFIIDEFIEFRKRGIYEDRMMRKLKAFSKAQVYFSDCGATGGGQIVISPNGQVGICHGCLFDKKYFVSNIYDCQ